MDLFILSQFFNFLHLSQRVKEGWGWGVMLSQPAALIKQRAVHSEIFHFFTLVNFHLHTKASVCSSCVRVNSVLILSPIYLFLFLSFYIVAVLYTVCKADFTDLKFWIEDQVYFIKALPQHEYVLFALSAHGFYCRKSEIAIIIISFTSVCVLLVPVSVLSTDGRGRRGRARSNVSSLLYRNLWEMIQVHPLPRLLLFYQGTEKNTPK